MEDVNAAGDDMAADSTVENLRGETPSYNESSPEAEASAEPSQEPAQPQKRKGGRKPVGSFMLRIHKEPMLKLYRYMLHPKSASNEIDKRRLLFESEERTTLNNSKPTLNAMRTRSTLYSKAIGRLLTNVSCFATRIRY